MKKQIAMRIPKGINGRAEMIAAFQSLMDNGIAPKIDMYETDDPGAPKITGVLPPTVLPFKDPKRPPITAKVVGMNPKTGEILVEFEDQD